MADSEKQSLRVQYKDLLPRVVVGVVLIAIALFGGWQGGLFFDFLMGLAALLMFREWARLVRLYGNDRLVGFVGIAAAIVLADANIFAMAFGALFVTAAWYVLRMRRAALGVLYSGLPFVALIWLRTQEKGFALIVWTLAVVWATDIFAYFAGRTIGGPKIAPSISPSKTWAGLIGGMTGAAIVGSALTTAFSLPFDPMHSAILGAALAIAAQCGDFYESHLKRRAGVKDSGHLLPGHGGIMDRLDGLVPVAMIVSGAVWLLGS